MEKQSAVILVLVAALAITVSADTTIDTDNRYAYGANIGWIDMRGDATHGAVITHSCCTGYVYSANCGWICLGNSPENGWEYGNDSATDWGVNHDGMGNLTGYSYGANIGWINFEQTYGQPQIDLTTGNMSGYVWGANVGWISLSNAEAHVQTTLATGPDIDGDSIPDDWEYKEVGNLADLKDGEKDYDGDGVPDTGEYAADTDPNNESKYLAITGYTAASGGTNDITWMATRPTRFYQLECCDMLSEGSGWDDSGLGVMAPDPGDTMTREVTINSTSQFFRVKGVVPLGP